MSDSEVRLELRARNNRLYKLIYGRYGSVAAFSEATGIHKIPVYNYLNLKAKVSPFLVNGGYSSVAIKIAEVFSLPPEYLFPPEIYRMDKVKIVVEVPFSDLKRLTVPEPDSTVAVLEHINNNQLATTFNGLFEYLTENEAYVLNRRYGLNGYEEGTLVALAEELGLSRARIRQIELRALRRIRHPKRSKKIKPFLDKPVVEKPVDYRRRIIIDCGKRIAIDDGSKRRKLLLRRPAGVRA